MRRFGLVSVCLVALIGPAVAQQGSDDVRISGTVQKFENGIMSISPSAGVVLQIRFDAGPGINSMRRAKVGDLKAGQHVSAQARSNPAGGLMAAQVVVYEQGAEQAAGSAASTNPAQVVATLTEVAATADGPQLSLAYRDGERKITLSKDVAVWIARPASTRDIHQGALITIAGQRRPEGEIKVIRASIGQPGTDNPPL